MSIKAHMATFLANNVLPTTLEGQCVFVAGLVGKLVRVKRIFFDKVAYFMILHRFLMRGHEANGTVQVLLLAFLSSMLYLVSAYWYLSQIALRFVKEFSSHDPFQAEFVAPPR